MSKLIIILCTVPSKDEGTKIAQRLIQDELAACVNMTGSVSSIFKWKGEICSEEEYILIIKTRSDLFNKIKEEILSLHPYELPEIISLPISDGLDLYLQWIRDNTVK